jgi:hypothetical protein
MKHPVLQSEFDIYFDHATGELPVWALDKDEAARVWCENFDTRSWVFFNLPADSWVELDRGVPAGDWQPAMNDKDYEPFRRSLSSVVPWRADDEVLFAATKAIVLQCTWETFLAHWQGFLYVHSDAPMLLSPQHPRQCVVFYPDGRSVFIDATQPG